MKIVINYDSCWRNSFLGGSNNEPLPEKGVRKFIGSMTSLKQSENFIKRSITLNTVMGVVNRLIGDQRKLYQARSSGNYFFKDIDFENTDKVKFKDHHVDTKEMTFIRNITGSTDQNSYTGAIEGNDPMFKSDYSAAFWGVFALNFNELCDFIVNGGEVKSVINLDPLSVIAKINEIGRFKTVDSEGVVFEAIEALQNEFGDVNYYNAKGKVVPTTLYCSALYVQLRRLSKTFDMSTAVTKNGVISGISKRSVTVKDFMNRFTTGDKKKIFGNPYIRKEYTKGVGEVVSMMTKASGTLEIELDVNKSTAKEIKTMIENAGVSSFYLGKKGLAYVDSINTSPMA